MYLVATHLGVARDPGQLAVLARDVRSHSGYKERRIYSLLLGPPSRPACSCSAYDWGDCIDVITVRGIDRTTAARLPKYDGLDIFAPTRALWHYMGVLELTVIAYCDYHPLATRMRQPSVTPHL